MSANPASAAACNERLRAFFDAMAEQRPRWLGRARSYHRQLAAEHAFWIPPGQRVLEVGCGLGDLLAATRPAVGVGVDLSPRMVERARARHPELSFLAGPIEELEVAGGPFDAIIVSDLLCSVFDIAVVIERLRVLCHPRTRVVVTFHSRLWEPLLSLLARLRLVSPRLVLNWVTREDVVGLLDLAGFAVVWTQKRILLPLDLPLLAPLCNRVLVHLWPFYHLCVSSVVVARPQGPPFPEGEAPGVSVVVPCRNEAGNIPEIVERIPPLGPVTEIVFVEGGSSDDTWQRCLEVQRQHAGRPERPILALQQTGRGKGDAVRRGFAVATQPVLMILDADMTVPPEDLPKFAAALLSGRVELVNGSRLVYAMDGRAMRFLNLVGNKFFAWAFTFLLGQRVKDTLCGTKVLLKADYERIAANRAYFGELDPFGDFDLLFGAAKLGLKIQDLPIRYRDRTYGDTNISRFSHGWLLLKMCWLALKRLKCR